MTLLTLLLACGNPSDSADTGKPDDTDTTDTADTDSGTTDTDTDTDSGTATTDGDGDGYASDVDCDDANAAIHPDAAELCDDVDNDCDTLVDSDDDSLTEGSTIWDDVDGDKYGDPATERMTCGSTTGYANNGGDCDDSNADISPNATEICDDADTDEDCDGKTDDDDPNVDTTTYREWPVDTDGDGYGSNADFTLACDAVEYSGDDCDDGDAEVNPGAEESCANGIDDNCDNSANDCALDGELTLSSDYELKLPGSTSNADFGTALVLRDDTGDGVGDVWVGESGAGSDKEGLFYFVEGPIGARMRPDEAIAIAGAEENLGLGAVARSADMDGDGRDDLIVSALGSSSYEGGVFIFTEDMTSGGTSDDAGWATSSETDRNYFGVHGLIVADLDNDGANDLAGWDEVDLALRVFYGPFGSGRTTSSSADVSLTTPTISYPEAGPTLLESGDVTGDGLAEIAIAIPNDSTSSRGGGTVWIMAGAEDLSGDFSTNAWLTLYGEGSNDGAGTDMTMSGDADGDGRADMVVGAPTAGSGGKVYFVTSELSGATTLASADFAVTGASGEYAGTSVEWVGDVDGDGVDDLAIGGTEDSTSATGAGRVSVFFGGVTESVDTSAGDFFVYGEASDDGCGGLVAGGIDMTGDAVNDLALTCPGNNRGAGALWFVAGGGL